MRNFSNTYIFVFSAIMVVLVAALLAIVAQVLKPRQERNVRVETMQNILTSVHIESTVKNADQLFHEYITESYVIGMEGNRIEEESALEVDLKEEVSKIDKIKKLESQIKERRESPFKEFLSGFMTFEEPDREEVTERIESVKDERLLPVYICNKEGEKFYIFPLRGKGLWGPIWGYVALESDLNTVYGAVFDHKSETPGLGAEIKESWFQEEFEGKQLFRDGEFVSIDVVKGGADPSDAYAVDGISGGTITSDGLEAMLYDCLSGYQTFFEQQRN